MRIILFIFIAFQLSYTYAQQLVFENVSDKLNLPSKECYNVMQDTKGYIWISTDAGLCKYDGNTLEIFDKNNGIPENSCYAVMEDSKGTVWIGTSQCRVLNYKNQVLKEVSYSKVIADTMVPKFQFIYSIKELDNQSLYFSSQHYSFETNTYTGKPNLLITNDSITDFCFQKRGNELICIKNGLLSANYNHTNVKKEFVVMQITKDTSVLKIRVPITIPLLNDWRVLTVTNKKGDMFISYYNAFVKIDSGNNVKLYTVPNRIVTIYCDKTDGLWVGTYKSGAFYYPDLATSELYIPVLPNYSVSGICEDQEEGIWCTTLEKGVFYSRNKNVISYQNVQGLDIKVEMLKTIEEKIYTSSIPGFILELDSNIILKKQFNLKENYLISDLSVINNKLYIIGPQFIKTIDNDGKEEFITLKGVSTLPGAIKLVEGPNDRIYIIDASRNLRSIIDNYVVHSVHPFLNTGTCLFYSKNLNKLLMGSKKGVYEADQDDLSLKKIPGIDGTVLKIIELKNGQLCFLTKESGIYLMDKNEIRRADGKLRLPASIFYDIAEDVHGHIWIGSNKGLIKVNPSNSPKVQIYNTSNGLPSNLIYKIAVNNRYIFISTEEGVSRFPINKDLSNTVIPKVSLDQFKVGEVTSTYVEGMVLPYYQNTLSFSFHLPMYKKMDETSFLYVLNGTEEKSELLNGNQLELNKLPSGKHSLTIFAVNNDGLKSQTPLHFQFEIKPPFWTTFWFIGAVAILVTLLILFFIRVIVRRIKAREEKKTELNRQLSEFRLNAIQAQMNPHFIFNAINSIQHYILSNETQAAYDYLAKFSKLIRAVLANSQSSVISLSKEIETLELYLELEQRRFKNRFDFTIHIDEKIDSAEVKLPVMLVQPFVENAIWHGIMNLDETKKGKLRIDISLETDFLRITVEDNGVGREKSKALNNQSNHTSMGTMLTEKRLDLLKEITHKDQRIIITDLYDKQHLAIGTKVEILLPNTI